MAVEARRGCGFRKIGGIYLVGVPHGAPCCKLPHPLAVCPTCGAGIKQSRGWTWIDAAVIFAGDCSQCIGDSAVPARECAHFCPLSDPAHLGRIGLLWIGARFYRTPAHFDLEAAALGISRRIAAVPRGFELGGSWVALAHPAVPLGGETGPAIFRVFRPTALEKILPASARGSPEVERLRAQHVTPVFVPDEDPDHQGSVYDDDEAAE